MESASVAAPAAKAEVETGEKGLKKGAEEFKATRDAIREVGERVTAEAVERAKAEGVEVEVALVAEGPVLVVPVPE